MKISLADLQKSGNPLWRKAAGGLPDPKPRKKRFTGLSSESKAWVREMSRGPGRFFQTSRIINWLNWRGHHMAKAKIAKQQRDIGAVEGLMEFIQCGAKSPFLCVLMRYGPKALDGDGLAASLKHFQDGVADALGIDDGDTKRLKFEYRQEISKWHGLRIYLTTQTV